MNDLTDQEIWIVLLALLVVFVAILGVNVAVAYFAVWVLWGFGVEVSFWPVFGSLILFQLLTSLLRISLGGK